MGHILKTVREHRLSAATHRFIFKKMPHGFNVDKHVNQGVLEVYLATTTLGPLSCAGIALFFEPSSAQVKTLALFIAFTTRML